METAKLQSESSWKKEGRILKAGEIPRKTVKWGKYKIQYRVYEFAQTVPKVKPLVTEPIILKDILLALRIVNQTAKRFRDAKDSLYHCRKHGLVSHFKDKQKNLYALKDKGIKWAYENQLLDYKGLHGGLCSFQSPDGKYFFHTFFSPVQEVFDDSSELILVESKERQKNLPRLKDAIFTLENLPDPKNSYYPLEIPKSERRFKDNKSSYPVSYNFVADFDLDEEWNEED